MKLNLSPFFLALLLNLKSITITVELEAVIKLLFPN